jgi:hypothetical protein
MGWLIPFLYSWPSISVKSRLRCLRRLASLTSWMVISLQEQGYWGPPVFGHDEIDNAMALGIGGYLQALWVADG